MKNWIVIYHAWDRDGSEDWQVFRAGGETKEEAGENVLASGLCWTINESVVSLLEDHDCDEFIILETSPGPSGVELLGKFWDPAGVGRGSPGKEE